MNIKQFKQWLNQFDDDVVVEVLVQETYQGNMTCVKERFNGTDEHYDYVDFNGNQFVKPTDGYYGKKFLTIGVAD